VSGERYDQRAELTEAERQALLGLGLKNLRRNRARGIPRRTAAGWRALSRLVGPLDAVRAGLHHSGDVRFRRAGTHAAAIVLHNCASIDRSYWAWTSNDWAQLCGSSTEAFVDAQPLPVETTVRPFLIALGYLLAGFDAFERLGTFNRLHLAGLVFGAEAVEEPLRAASAVLDQWGYRSVLSAKHRVRGVFSQALLINRSTRLEDLDSAAFDRLHAHPATNAHHGELLYALQRAVAALGHCQPPVRTGYNHAPGIEGTDLSWANWIERWYDTSTLTRGCVPPSAPSWPRSAGGWPPNIPRSPSPGSGPGRPAPAGSRPWTAWRSVTTSSAVITSTPGQARLSRRGPRRTT
jgi:hypothetical protein